MTLQTTFQCVKDVQLVHSAGGTDGGVGAGNVISVGSLGGGHKSRSELAFQPDWSSIVSLVQVNLLLRVTNACGAPGAAVKFYAERLTSDFKEGSYADTCGVGASNSEVFPGTGTATTTHRAQYVGTPADGDYIKLDVTALVADAQAANDDKVRIRLIASDGAGGYDELTAARYVGFWSREKGNDGQGFKPRLEVVALTTHRPNAPTEVTPATTNADTAAPTATRVDTSFVVRAKFTDADANDYLTASHVQAYPKGSTDDANGNILVGTEIRNLVGTGVKADYRPGALLVAHPVTVPASAGRVGLEMMLRLRMRDKNGLWGPWTRLAAMRVIPDTRPSAPTGLAVDTGSTSPDMTGRHNDVDRGSTVHWVETQVVHEDSGVVEMLMNRTSRQPGDPTTGSYLVDPTAGGPQTVPAGGTLWRVSYDGSRPLRPGERVKRRHRTADQFGAVGDWSAWLSWVVGTATVPTFIPDPATKRDDLTPLLGCSYPAQFTGMWVEVYQRNDLASLLLWSSGERTFAAANQRVVEYGSVGSVAKPLAWGQQPWGRARVRSGSTISPWTELQPILLNSLPLAPSVTADLAQLGPDGVWRVPTLTPRLVAPFSDPDRPNDTATKRVVQVYQDPPGATALYQSIITAAIEDWADVPQSAGLQWERAYIGKVRHADTSGELGPFGQFQFTTHRPAGLATGTAPVAANPRPTINWTPTFYGGATQAQYRVVLYDTTNDAGLYDTGDVNDTSATSWVVPAYVLPNGAVVQARVYVTDTLGVTQLLIGQASVNSAINASSQSTAAMVATTSTTPGGSLPADTFTRGAVTDSWGTSSSGHVYVYGGTPADFDTNGTQGTMVLAAAATRRAHFYNARLGNVTAQGDVKTDKLAVGSTLAAGVHIRCLDLTNHYAAELVFNTDATVDLVLARFVDGVRTVLGVFRTAITHVAGTFYTVKVNAVTSYVAVSGGASYYSTVLQAKAWATGGGEPGYQVSATDATAVLQDPLGVGVGARAASGITNAPVTATWDNLATTSP